MDSKDSVVEWVKENLEPIEIYRDYTDEPLSNETVGEILDIIADARRSGIKSSAEVMLKDYLCDQFINWYEDYLFQSESDAVDKLIEQFPDLDPDDAHEIITELLDVNYPIDSYLSDKYDVVVSLDTGDSDYDFVLNTVEPAYDGSPISEISDKASVVWLAKQQGYSKEEFIRRMEERQNGTLDKEKYPFIDSLYIELKNSHSHMNCVVFLGKMTLLEIAQAQDNGVSLPKSAVCGLYDSWNGSGGPLEIKLEKDLYIPQEAIYHVGPDGYGMSCSIDRCYGLTSQMYDTPLYPFRGDVYTPEQIHKAKSLFSDIYPKDSLESEFAREFSRSLLSGKNKNIDNIIYEGMLNLRQLEIASYHAIREVLHSHDDVYNMWKNRGKSPIDKQRLRTLLELAPVPLSEDCINEYHQWIDRYEKEVATKSKPAVR